MIKIGIFGYGNLAKGVEKAVLKNPDFKQAYDELEEEFNLLNEKLTAENKKILSVSNEETLKLKNSRLRRKIKVAV